MFVSPLAQSCNNPVKKAFFGVDILYLIEKSHLLKLIKKLKIEDYLPLRQSPLFSSKTINILRERNLEFLSGDIASYIHLCNIP